MFLVPVPNREYYIQEIEEAQNHNLSYLLQYTLSGIPDPGIQLLHHKVSVINFTIVEKGCHSYLTWTGLVNSLQTLSLGKFPRANALNHSRLALWGDDQEALSTKVKSQQERGLHLITRESINPWSTGISVLRIHSELHMPWHQEDHHLLQSPWPSSSIHLQMARSSP